LVNIKNICIIGAGNIGVTAAVDISQNPSYKVTLISSRANEINNTFKKIDSDTGIETIGKNITVTNDYKEALNDCDLAIITIPSFLIYEIIKKLPKNKLKMILFLPGYGGKEFYCKELHENGCIVAGVDRSPYVARLLNKNTVKASSKKSIRLAILKDQISLDLCSFVEKLFKIPCMPLNNYLTVTFTPSNPILHTSRLYALFNDSSNKTKFPRMIKFYAEWNDASSELLFQMDSELQKICKSYPQIDLSGVVPNPIHYESPTPQLLTKKITSISSLSNIDSPMIKNDNFYLIDFNSRYFVEDFKYGLALLKAFALITNVETPYFDKVLKWYSRVSGDKLFDEQDKLNLSTIKSCPQNFNIITINDIINYYV